MKKILVSFALILALLMSFAACKPKEPVDPQPGETVYDILNSLCKKSYGKIQLDITTKTGDAELKANYLLTATNVTYTVEQLSLLPSDGKPADIVPSYKTTLTGTATVENGKVTKLDGDAVTLPTYDELKGTFQFKEEYFKSVESTDAKFAAEVTSVSGFLGIEKPLQNLKVNVDYTSDALTKITLTYQTANATVTTVYTFEK